MWVPVRRPGQAEDTALLTAAARLFVRGVAVDWARGVRPAASRGGWTCRPTRSSGSGTGRAPACAAGGVPVAGADGAEAGFWAAVDQAGRGRGWPGRCEVRGDAPLSAVLPVLSRWRRRRREQAVLDGWRYRVTWQPVPDPEPAHADRPVAAGGARPALAEAGLAG